MNTPRHAFFPYLNGLLDVYNFTVPHICSDKLKEAQDAVKEAMASIEASSSKDESLCKVVGVVYTRLMPTVSVTLEKN